MCWDTQDIIQHHYVEYWTNAPIYANIQDFFIGKRLNITRARRTRFRQERNNHRLPLWKEPTNGKKMVGTLSSFLKKGLLRPVHSFTISAPTSSRLFMVHKSNGTNIGWKIRVIHTLLLWRHQAEQQLTTAATWPKCSQRRKRQKARSMLHPRPVHGHPKVLSALPLTKTQNIQMQLLLKCPDRRQWP
jgi:hypothetical protein